jgi:hypothetical protein
VLGVPTLCMLLELLFQLCLLPTPGLHLSDPASIAHMPLPSFPHVFYFAIVSRNPTHNVCNRLVFAALPGQSLETPLGLHRLQILPVDTGFPAQSRRNLPRRVMQKVSYRLKKLFVKACVDWSECLRLCWVEGGCSQRYDEQDRS